MNSEKFYASLSEDVKQKLSQCETKESIRDVLAEAGIEPLGDDVLEAVSGGTRGPLVADCYKKGR